jgi:3-hydroxy-9,10-secoandrosta-1,3,5(10)-triene-9,17-dione monooxygenase reductase component
MSSILGIRGGQFDQAHYRHVLSHLPTGVAVITADADGPVGLVVGSLTSVSMRPFLVSFCAQKTSRAWASIRDRAHFGVNVLAASQRHLGRALSRPPAERFDGIDWTPREHGLPQLTGSLAWMACRAHAVYEAGDHDLVLGEVEDLDVLSGEDPLVFLRGGYPALQTIVMSRAGRSA